MTFNQNRLGLAVSGTFGVLYIVCALFVWVAPEAALSLLSWLTHIVNVDKFAGDVALTPAGFFAGLAQVVLYSYVAGWLFGWFYNNFPKKHV